MLFHYYNSNQGRINHKYTLNVLVTMKRHCYVRNQFALLNILISNHGVNKARNWLNQCKNEKHPHPLRELEWWIFDNKLEPQILKLIIVHFMFCCQFVVTYVHVICILFKKYGSYASHMSPKWHIIGIIVQSLIFLLRVINVYCENYIMSLTEVWYTNSVLFLTPLVLQKPDMIKIFINEEDFSMYDDECNAMSTRKWFTRWIDGK